MIYATYQELYNHKVEITQNDLFRKYITSKLFMIGIFILLQSIVNYFMFKIASPEQFMKSDFLQWIAKFLPNSKTARIDIFALFFINVVILIVLMNITISYMKYDDIKNMVYLLKIQDKCFVKDGKYYDTKMIRENTLNIVDSSLKIIGQILSILIPTIMLILEKDNRKIGLTLLCILIGYLGICYGFCIMIGFKGKKFGEFMSKEYPKLHALQDSVFIYRRSNREDQYNYKLLALKEHEISQLISFTNIFQYILLGVSFCVTLALIIIARQDATVAFGITTFMYSMFQIPYAMNNVFSKYYENKGLVSSFNDALYYRPQGKKKISDIKSIEFKNFTFMRKGKDIFSNYNLNINIKEKFHLIMGPSGSGKSTLVTILAQEQVATDGFSYQPTNAYINGIPIDDIDPKSLKEITLYIPQGVIHTSVFSIREIFKMYAPNITNQEISKYLLLVGLEERIKNYDTNPYGLSGGEKHRLFIACMLASKPNAKLILLDEITAALSESMSIMIVNNIKADNPNALILCVTHLNALAEENNNIIYLTDQAVDSSE